MSQIIKDLTSGPLPPTVPTSFVTDDGTVIPAANVVNLNGGSTIDNNINGIQVIANPDLSNNAEFQLTNLQNDTLTTSGNTPTILSTFTMPATPAVQNYEYKISAFNSTATLGAVYLIIAGARTTGVSATSLNTADITTIEEGAMSGCLVAFGVSGNTVTVTVTGLAANTINWSSQLKYTQVS